MESLLLGDIDVKIDSDIREKQFAFKWTIQKVSKIPLPVRSLRFSLVGDDNKDWYATVSAVATVVGSERKFSVSLTCDSLEPIPLRIEHSSKAFDTELESLGGTSTAPVYFQARGDERVLLKEAKLTDDNASFECSMKIYGFDVNTSYELSNTTDKRDVDLVEYLDGFRNLMHDKSFADVKITAVGKEFFVHRCILKYRAPKFLELHGHDIRKGELVINSIEHNIFQSLLAFVYTGEEEQLPATDDYRKLYLAAHRYALAGLQRRCGKVLSAKVSVDSVVDLFILAHQKEDEQLSMQCLLFMKSHLKELSGIVKFINLLKCNLNVEEKMGKIHM